jgi:hypothetical protein
MPRTPQPLHIFRKDLMHLWPETLAVVALFAAFAWAAPSHWTGSEYAGIAGLLSIFLKVLLMPISWLVVISRLIHDEPLVGDRQFWTSRPYHWASLLAAKILYLIAFLYLPFLLMQVYLLKHAGLYPTTVLPELLHNLLLLTVVVVIPIAAISAVTSSFPRVLLSVVAAVIYLIIVALVVVYLIFRRMPAPELEPLLTTLFVVLPAAALVTQYATRRTLISRSILIATPLLIALLIFLTPATALIRSAYPVASTPRLGAIPDALMPKSPQAGSLVVIHGKVQLAVPFTIADADKDSNYLINGVAASIEAPGVHWSSPYITAFGEPFNIGTPYRVIPVEMPLEVFNQLHQVPADVHLSLAVQQLKADKPTAWKATLQPFSVPGHGVCAYAPQRPEDPPVCSYPFKLPEVNYVSAPLAADCSQPAASQTTGVASLGGTGTTLDFDPVVTEPLRLQPRGAQQGASYLLCPGTALTFIEAHRQAKNRFEVDEKQLNLDNLATHNKPLTPELNRQAPPPLPDQE